jgi:hypothetical protein
MSVTEAAPTISLNIEDEQDTFAEELPTKKKRAMSTGKVRAREIDLKFNIPEEYDYTKTSTANYGIQDKETFYGHRTRFCTRGCHWIPCLLA